MNLPQMFCPLLPIYNVLAVPLILLPSKSIGNGPTMTLALWEEVNPPL